MVNMSSRTVIAVLALAMAANATELSIEHGVLAPGKPVSLDVTISAGTDKPTGIQFDLQYDAVALDMTIDAGPAAVQAGKSLRAAKIEPGRQRILIIGFNKNVISDGVLAILHVSYKGRETGKTFSIHVVGAAGTNEKAQALPVTGKDGSVKVEKGRGGQ
jgi:Cohesin domain